jgi:hypothetical protein
MLVLVLAVMVIVAYKTENFSIMDATTSAHGVSHSLPILLGIIQVLVAGNSKHTAT